MPLDGADEGAAQFDVHPAEPESGEPPADPLPCLGDPHPVAGRRQPIGRHQAGQSRSDDGDFGTGGGALVSHAVSIPPGRRAVKRVGGMCR